MKKAVRLFILIVASVECYKLKILNFTECRNPDPPIMKNVREKWSGTIEPYTEHNKTLLKGNVTLLQDVQFYIRFKVVDQQKRNNNAMAFKGITCRNIVARMLMQFTNFKYNANDCKVLKGNYIFKGLDIARIEQLVTYIPMQKLGYKLWYFVLYHDEGSYVCYEISILYE